MKTFIVLLACVFSIWTHSIQAIRDVRTQNNLIESRIVGGEIARPGQFPFVAAVYVDTNDGRFFCGGTLMAKKWILTAASCISNAVSFTVLLAAVTLNGNDAERLTLATEDYVVHPDYNPLTLENDIGLIRLRMEILFTDYVNQIQRVPIADLRTGVSVVTLGWGQLDDESAGPINELQYVNLTTISNEECRITYGNQITDFMICIAGNYNEGTCVGDNGGPLLEKTIDGYWTIVGVASFVSGKGCESLDPSGFTRTFGYMFWINDILLSG